MPPGNADAPAPIPTDPHLEGNAPPRPPLSEVKAILNAPDPEAIHEPLEPVRKTTKLQKLWSLIRSCR